MTRYEYKVVPAPVQGKKGKGVKGGAERFAYALESLMNELGAEGWEYVRADTLPCEERTGLTGRTTVYQNTLVFRRVVLEVVEESVPAAAVAGLLAAPLPEPPLPEPPVTAAPVAAAPASAGPAAAVVPAAPEARGDAGAGVPGEPPMTRGVETVADSPTSEARAPAAPMSEAARAAAAALRTYRAANGAGSGGAAAGPAGPGRGVAAE